MTWHLLIAMADTQRAQYLAVAGFVMLGWVLARRTLKARKRVNTDTRVAKKELDRIRSSKTPVLPLADAPPEVQRWQVGMFDLQRELKAELDTRIVIVQTLLRQVDESVRRLEKLQGVADDQQTAVTEFDAGVRRSEVESMVQAGHTAEEIAAATGMPIGDVEITIATIRVG
ncbi:hypothetical protein K227x_60660 [Rubripirellula lacrimiformis]|uniref:DUF2802 domain-containing protein n=1 Tax=Rubripirellula lacrimiformis TaxID=1930273 RepID=A0A517NKH1_9BACT|nr:hypothetical protein [Rubripirellula lacrimiformis]QDT07638.1 hypothetical protein K227x_60660 [Rubripirellula lacrimiformis]